MKGPLAGVLVVLTILPGFSSAAVNGNFSGREITDVVFRRLNDAPEVHGSIYVGQTNKAGVPPALPIFHEVIEMTGILDHGVEAYVEIAPDSLGDTTGMSGRKKVGLRVKPGGVGLIGFSNFDDFQRAHPAYYGSFMHPSYPGMEIRKDILRKAQKLKSRYVPIEYIVMPGESASELLYKYFRYYTTASDVLTDDDIDRMRSDAFVEYCYAAAGRPIMADNITLKSGADALEKKWFPLPIYPSDQRDRMTASLTGNPVLKVFDKTTGNLVVNTASTTSLRVELKDFQSGPGLLTIRRSQGEYLQNEDINPFSWGIKSGESILADRIGDTQNADLSKSSGIVAGYTYNLRAYDHAGNYSDFAFTVAGKPVFGGPYSDPLYENFSGDTALIPSVLAGAHSFSFSDGIAGVSSVQMTGPPGNVISWTFDPPVTSTHTTLADMAPGQYSVKIINSVGGETNASFNLGSLLVGISTPASHQNISAPGDRLAGGALASVTLRAPLQSANELDRAELTDEVGRVLQTLNLAPNSSEALFSLPVSTFPEPLFLPSAYPEPPYARYALKLWDKKGNYKRDFFTLALENFGRHEEPLTLPEGAPYVRGAIVDLQNYAGAFGPGNYTQLPGALVSPYYVKTGTNGVRSVDLGILASVTSYAPVDWETTPRPYMGSLTLKVRTGGQPNLSDAVEYTLISGPVYGSTTPIEGAYYVGLGYLMGTPLKVRAERYIQAEAQFTSGLARGDVTINSNLFWAGLVLAGQTYPTNDFNVVDIGENVRADLAGGQARVDFPKVTVAGKLTATARTTRAPPGFLEQPANVTYELTASSGLAFTGTAKLTLKYDPAGLTPHQIGMLRLVRIVDPATGDYEDLGGTPGAGNTISADVSSFGRFMAAVPEYALPQKTTKQNLEFLAGAAVTSDVYDMATQEGQGLLQAMKSRDLMPVGGVTRLGPDGLRLEPSGVVTMRYSDADVLALGVDEASLAIYQFTADGGTFAKLPYLTLNRQKNELTARVPYLSSLFAIMASSRQVENIPPAVYPDGIPPVTSMAFGGLAAPVADGVYISTVTGLGFSAADPQAPDVETSGFLLTNYLLDPDATTVDISTFTTPLISTEGLHTLYYFSVDKALNYEFVKSATVYADGTPPAMEPDSDSFFESAGELYAAVGSSITLRVDDPLSNGVRSGGLAAFYLVGVSTESCPALAQLAANPPAVMPQFSGVPGTCANPLYSGPFTLAEGTRSLAGFSVDNVGNAEKPKKRILHVDGTAPRTDLLIQGVSYDGQPSAYAAESDSITVTAEDIVSNGVASGLATTYLLINVTPEFCKGGGTGGGVNNFGSCENPYYTGAFSLPVGTHTVYYSGEDYVGNGDLKGITVVVGSARLDRMPGGYARKIAGTGAYGYSGDGGDALAAAVGSPMGSVVDAAGNLIFADSSFSVVRKITPEGKIFTIAGTGVAGFSGDGGPAVAAQLNKPQDVALDAQGNIYIADTYNNKVRKISAATGNIETVADVPYVESVALDKAGNLYAGEMYWRVDKVLPDGQKVLYAGNGTRGFAGDGGPAVSAKLSAAKGLSFDDEGNLYIADTSNQRVRRVDRYGVITTVAGGGSLSADNVPALQKSLGYVMDTAVGQGGELFIGGMYVLSHLDNKTGLIETLAGDGATYLSTAPVPAAFLSAPYPQGICADGSAGLYFSANSRIGKMIFPGMALSADKAVKLYFAQGGVEISSKAADSAESVKFLSAAARAGLLPAGAVYSFGAQGAPVSSSGEVLFKYDPLVVKDTSTLSIYTYDGVSLSSASSSGLRGQLIQRFSYGSGNIIAAEVQRVPYLSGLLMEVVDRVSPRSSLAIGVPAFGSAPAFVSPRTPFSVSSSDDLYSAGDKKGFGVAALAVKIKKDGAVLRELWFENFSPAPGQVFVSTFSLDQEASGAYVLEYSAVDLRGNSEPAKTAAVILDADGPSVDLVLDGTVREENGVLNSLAGFDMRITTGDALSGVAAVRYVVDTDTGTCDWAAPVVSSAPVGTCANPVYSGPFRLPGGPHSVYVAAEDNVGNKAAFKKYQVNILSAWYDDPARWPYYEYLRGFGSAGSGSGNFSDLKGIGFDASGNVWVGDTALGRIQVFDQDGGYLKAFSSGLSSLQSFSICPDGTFWAVAQVAGGYDMGLKKFSAPGVLLKEINISGSQQLSYAYPRFVVCGRDNRPFVAANTLSGSQLLAYDSGGNYLSQFPLGIASGGYQGLAADGEGNLLVLDYSGVQIKKFSPAGTLLSVMPIISSASASLSLDAFGNMYVPNHAYGSVDIYNSTGGFVSSVGDVAASRQMILMGSPRYAGVHPFSGRLYVGGAAELRIYGADRTPPAAAPEIVSPPNSIVVYASAPFVAGLAEAVSKVDIYEGARHIVRTAADREGKFSLNLPGLSPGWHRLTLRNSDLAGNISSQAGQLEITLRGMNQPAFNGPVWGPGYSVVGYSVVDTSATVLADFDRDGKKDVLGFSRGGKYSFYKGAGNGAFQYVYTAQLPGMSAQYSGGDDAVAADFNGDGFVDVAASVYNPLYPYADDVLVFLAGNGDGTFQAPVVLDHLIAYSSLAKGDFNKDGSVDIAGASGGNIKIYLGGPGGLFLTISTTIPAELPSSRGGGVSMADIDGDGKADVLFRNAVLYGDGAGGFEGTTILPYNYQAGIAEVGKSLVSDFNQDGRMDIGLVAAKEFDVFMGAGNRVFHKIQTLYIQWLYAGASGDFNGDAVVDAVISPYRLQNVFVLSGRGDGTFEAPLALPTGGYSQYGHLSGTISAEDINSDGKSDIFQASSELGVAGGDINTFFSFLNTSAAPDTVPPAVAAISVENTPEGEVAVSWTAPGNNGNDGTAATYDLRYANSGITSEAAFAAAQRVLNIASPRTAGSQERFTLPGLAGGAAYYFALKSYDAVGNASALSNSPSVVAKYVAVGAGTVGGAPEISMVSHIQPSITQIPTASGPGALALGGAGAQSLTIASNMYDIKPEMVYAPPAMLTFYYSTAAVEAAGLRDAEVFVYEHFSDGVWRQLPDQIPDRLNHKITVPITQVSSLFGIFGVVRDRTAPVTEFSVSGSSWGSAGMLFISTASSLGLSAADPVVYGTASGVAFTEFRVDAGTTAPFAPYVAPFVLTAGAHVLEFRSGDNAGNLEAAKTVSVFADGEPPAAGLSFAGSSHATNGQIFTAAGATVTLSAIDEASGVAFLRYEINGATSAAVSSALLPLGSGGRQVIVYQAVDNVGNASPEQRLEVIVDTAPPATVVVLGGVLGANGWYVSQVGISLDSADELSGVVETSYSIDGGGFALYASSFAVSAEGRHGLSFYSRDNVGNTEGTGTFSLGIDISTPEIIYALLPAANAERWNKGPVEVVFTGSDAVSGVEYCSSSFSIVSEGKDIPVSGYCRDFAGWSSTAAFTVNIDTTPPDIAYTAEPAPNAAGWNNSDVTLRFACSDGLSGVSACPAEIVLYGEGLGISTTVVARDYADNTRQLVAGGLNIDRTAPVSRAILYGTLRNGWYTSEVEARLLTSDALSGAVGLLYSLDGGPYESYAAPVVVGADGRHTLRYYAVDAAGNSEAGKTLSFDIDTTAPAVGISSPAAGAVFLAGRDMLNVAFAVTDALDSAPVSTAALVQVLDKGTPLGSGAANIAVVNGQVIEPLALDDGLWRLEVTAADAAGNSTQAVSGVFEVVHDTLAPVTTLAIGEPKSGAEPVVISSVTPLLLSATDDMLLAGDGLGTGVAVTYLSLDGAAPVIAAGEFFISSEGAHTLLYYSVDKAGNTELAHNLTVQVAAVGAAREVMLNFGPSVINLKSEGQYVTATLAVSSLAGVGFAEDNVRITKVNGIAISTPVYSQAPGASGKKGKEQKYSISVKFNRQSLIAVLPVNAVSVVTVEGSFDDDTVFVAEDSLRVINPGSMGKGKGGRLKHHSRACLEVGVKALKEDSEISVLNLHERASERLERDRNAVKNGFTRRGEPFEFGPEGTVFDEPVEISLPYENYDAKTEKLQVAYWNPSSKDWEPLTSTLDTAEKVVKAKVGHFSLYQVVVSTIAEPRIIRPASEQPVVGVQDAGPSAAFVLGEVYVYPNPAKGGAVPIFHMECGIADSVDIKVYTVSGREAHEATLTAMPAVIEQRYAYEYAWQGHIPSGVYLYFIEARKGGQKIKKTGKFAVVR